jgi:competence protein ComEC
MPSSVLSKVPVLRILIPFIFGIILSAYSSSVLLPAILIIAGICVYLFLSLSFKSPLARLRTRSLFYIPIVLIALSVGWLASTFSAPPTLNLSSVNGSVVTARIDKIKYSDFSMSMRVSLKCSYRNGSFSRLKGNDILLSTRGCDYSLHPGDVIAFRGALQPVRNMGNPYEMDYAAYLRNNGIIYSQHVKTTDIMKYGSDPTWLTRNVVARTSLQNKVLSSSLSPASQSFIIALLLGNDDFIDYETRYEFSNAGIAHVLALSGLHIGVLSLIIWWILFPLDYLRLRKLRLFITLVVLVVFDIFTGLSSSVIRSTVMFAIVFTSYVFYRRSSSLNALATAALVILVGHPASLYDVGFQLSFITVGAILLFFNRFDFVSRRHRVLRYVYSLLVTSTIAMVATVLLTAHYFHTISFLSVVTNVFVLPAFPFFMLIGAAFVFLTSIGVEYLFIDRIIDFLYSYIFYVVRHVNMLPFSHIDSVYVTTFSVVAYFIALLLLSAWLYSRSWKYVIAAASVIVVALFHSAYYEYSLPRRGLIIMNSYDSTPVIYYNNHIAYAWCPDNEIFDADMLKHYYNGFLAHSRIDSVTVVDSLPVILPDAFFRPPFVYACGRRLMSVGLGRWKHKVKVADTVLDAVIVTRKFHSNITLLRSLYNFHSVIFSGDVYPDVLDSLQHECDSLRVPYYSVASRGAFSVNR